MADNKTGNLQEYQKINKNSIFVIDKVTICEIIVGVIVIFAGMLGIFYLAGVFK